MLSISDAQRNMDASLRRLAGRSLDPWTVFVTVTERIGIHRQQFARNRSSLRHSITNAGTPLQKRPESRGRNRL